MYSGPLPSPRSGGRGPGSITSPKPGTIGEIKDHEPGSGKDPIETGGKMGVLDGGNAESGTEGGFDTERRRVLKVFGCAAAAVAVAPVVLRRRAWGAVAPPALEGETRVLGSTGVRVGTVGMGALITRHPDVSRYAVGP